MDANQHICQRGHGLGGRRALSPEAEARACEMFRQLVSNGGMGLFAAKQAVGQAFGVHWRTVHAILKREGS